jgi:HPt (histidine-containing phosphotransfer) domain-containing protein
MAGHDAAHAAKGASASVGAVLVAGLLEKLQFAAAEADWGRIEGLMPKIETEFTKLGKYVQTLEAA